MKLCFGFKAEEVIADLETFIAQGHKIDNFENYDGFAGNMTAGLHVAHLVAGIYGVYKPYTNINPAEKEKLAVQVLKLFKKAGGKFDNAEDEYGRTAWDNIALCAERTEHNPNPVEPSLSVMKEFISNGGAAVMLSTEKGQLALLKLKPEFLLKAAKHVARTIKTEATSEAVVEASDTSTVNAPLGLVKGQPRNMGMQARA